MAFKYFSTKTYNHSAGFSCAFRQWRAQSHCRFLHGYPIKIEFVFGTNELDVRNWVVDFGSCKSLKGWLEDLLDHKTLVATDDPQIEWYRTGHKLGTLDLVEIPATGMERLAEYIYGYTDTWLVDNGYSPRVGLVSVQVWEHESNSAIYKGLDTSVNDVGNCQECGELVRKCNGDCQ